MRILVLLSVTVLLAGLYFVLGLRKQGSAEHSVSAAAANGSSRLSSGLESDPRLAIEAVATRVEALATEVARLRDEVERARPAYPASAPAAPLDEDEFRRAYRDTIVKILAEERQRQTGGNRSGLLRSGVQRYLISHRLDSDAHAREWEDVLEGALARADELKTSAPSPGSSDPDAGARAAEWQRQWSALRAETYARLAESLEPRHVEVLLDMVFHF